MKNKIISFLIAVIGTVGFNSCGPTTGTTEENTGTGTETTAVMGSAGDGTEDAVGTTGEETRITGTPDNETEPPPGAVRITPQDPEDSIFYIHEPTAYVYENEDYRFSPDENGFSITRVVNGHETEYGTARNVEDEYYIVNRISATEDEENVVGRFDNQGNFTIFKYDRDKGDVVKDTFQIQDPVDSE